LNAGDAPAGFEHLVEGVKGEIGILTIHEVAEIVVQYFFPGIAEDAAQRVIEKKEISFDVGFKEGIGDIFDKNAVPVPWNAAGFQLAVIRHGYGSLFALFERKIEPLRRREGEEYDFC
jgi:hypothetical protein